MFVEIIHNPRQSEHPQWTLWLREKWDKRGVHAFRVFARWDDMVDGLHVGSPVTAYRFSDAEGYVFPRFEHDPRGFMVHRRAWPPASIHRHRRPVVQNMAKAICLLIAFAHGGLKKDRYSGISSEFGIARRVCGNSPAARV